MVWHGSAAFVLWSILLGAGVQAPYAPSPEMSGGSLVALNGTQLWYRVAGTARPNVAPLLYLAGGPGYNSFSFEHTMGSQLETHLQVIYFDERGTGRSDRPANKDYAMSTLVTDIEALRQRLGLPQLSLMGQSFGGTIALEYAKQFPGQVQKLILVDAASDVPDALAAWERELKQREPAQWTAAMIGAQGEALKQAEQDGHACSLAKARFAVIWSVYQQLGAGGFHHWQQFHNERFAVEQEAIDARSGLRNTGEMSSAYFSANNDWLCYRFTAYGRLTMPVLVIEGKYDGAVDPPQAERLAKRVRTARYDQFDNSAHFPYAEEPAKFERDVTAFLIGPQTSH